MEDFGKVFVVNVIKIMINKSNKGHLIGIIKEDIE